MGNLYCNIGDMKKLLQIIVLFFALALPVFATSYDQVMGNSKTTIILFKMRGCPTCMQYEPIFDSTAAKYSNQFTFIKEDAPSSPLASQLGLEKVPEVYIVNPSTKQIYKAPDSIIFQQDGLGNILRQLN